MMPTIMGFFAPTPRVSKSDYLTFLREGLFCGSVVLGASAASDYLYFGTWTFPPYQFLRYNVSLDLASFYGRNDWHYYLSQGLPLLLTTYLPFALIGLAKSTQRQGIQSLLSVIILTTIAALSQISHKEVRFIYPLLPLLHILAAPAVSACKSIIICYPSSLNIPCRMKHSKAHPSHTSTPQPPKPNTHPPSPPPPPPKP